MSFPFESSVISYGSQTNMAPVEGGDKFESSVISYGSQTTDAPEHYADKFESSVISYINDNPEHWVPAFRR